MMEDVVYILSIFLLFIFIFLLIKSSDDKKKPAKKDHDEKKDPDFVEIPELQITETQRAILDFARHNPEKTAFVIRQLFFSDKGCEKIKK